MNSWLGKTKMDIIGQAGPPARVASDGGFGEILIYSQQGYSPFAGGAAFYKNTMFYVNSAGIIYRWLIQRGGIPPERIDVNLYVR